MDGVEIGQVQSLGCFVRRVADQVIGFVLGVINEIVNESAIAISCVCFVLEPQATYFERSDHDSPRSGLDGYSLKASPWPIREAFN